MSENHNNFNDASCAFAKEIVSYLYGEIDAREKTLFETHLTSCAACAEDLAGFSQARFSIGEWRDEEFLPLSTPAIEIPFVKNSEIYRPENVSAVSLSWFEQLHRLFAVSPALTVSASLALVIVCLGVLFFADKSLNNIDVAEVANINTKQIISPSNQNESSSATTNSENSEKKTDSTYDKESKSVTVARTGDGQKNFPAKVADVPKNPTKNSSFRANLPKVKAAVYENKKPAFAQTGKVPRLNNLEEEEDKSLRLAELFNDGDAR